MKFHQFWPPTGKFVWLPVKNSANALPLEKSFRRPW